MDLITVQGPKLANGSTLLSMRRKQAINRCGAAPETAGQRPWNTARQRPVDSEAQMTPWCRGRVQLPASRTAAPAADGF